MISTDYIQNQIEAKGSTNYSSIRAKEFLEYEIPLPSLNLQTEISKRFLTFSDFKTKLNVEHASQQTYLTKLRQTILQEAIEGKLTPDWGASNPVCLSDPNTDAAALLEKIKAEKQKLIVEGKIKNNKPLAPIKPDDVPFDLPAGWVWVTIDDIFQFINGKAHEQFVSNEGNFILINSRFVSTSGQTKKYSNFALTPLQKNDIAIVMSDVPNGRALGRAFLINENDKFTLNQRIGGLKTFSILNHKYLLTAIDRNKHFLNFDDCKKQTNLKKEQIISCPIAIPPLAEQQAIVHRVDRLLKHVNELEQQGKERKSYAELLMQAVLKEAFSR